MCRLAFLPLVLQAVFGCLSSTASDWPQWRGPNRDGHALEESLLATLPSELKPIWKRPVGTGFSAPVVAGEVLIYLDEQGGRETAHALAPSTGVELWKVAFADAFSDEWGVGPRSTPVMDGDRVYVQSCKGEFRCLSMKDGQVRWGTDFEKNFGVIFVGTKVNEGAAIRRGNNGSALIDESHLIVPVGSTNGASIVCFDKLTGAVLWKSLNDESAYASPILATLAGLKQIVAFTADALVGLDRADGHLLWRVPIRTDAKRHALSPVILSGDRVVVASHSFGMICVHVAKDSGGFSASTAWHNRAMKVNLSTPVAVSDSLFGFGTGQDYVCLDSTTGQVRWAQPGFGRGVKTDYASSIVVGDTLLVLNETGLLSLIAVDPLKYRSLGQVQVCGKTWSFPALAHGRLYVRDGRDLQCFDLSAR